MEPIRKSSKYRLYHGDCLELLAQMRDKSVDAVITDPPYNLGVQYEGDDSKDQRDQYGNWCQQWMEQLKRICRGSIAVSPGMVNLSLWATICPPDWWIAWWKPAAMGRGVIGYCNWEPIAFYGKPHKRSCDVIQAGIRPDRNLDWHPCPKPIEWAIRQLEIMTPRGAIVLDPFMGSGTVGVACMRRDRRFVGIEQSLVYLENAWARISKANYRPTLFDRQ